jgi:hypothetical protein
MIELHAQRAATTRDATQILPWRIAVSPMRNRLILSRIARRFATIPGRMQ